MPTTVKIRRSGTASATPSALEHGEIAINYADGKVFWKNASNVITSFTFQSYALASHTHSISDVTGLQTALDGKASSSHTHGNISNAGAIGSTADQFVVTTTSGVLTAVSAATARTTLSVQPTASPAFTGAATFAGSVQLNLTNAPLDSAGNLRVFTTDTQAADKGGQIGLGGQNGSAGSFDPWSFAVIKGAKENSTSGNLAGYVVFATANSGGVLGERLRISSTGTATFAGQVRVNTADSATALLVNGATRGVRFNTSTDGTRIEGVDNTGVGSYQPLILNGSTVTIQSNGGTSAITVGTSQTATFSGQIVGQAGAVLTGTVAGNVRQLRMQTSGSTRWEVGPGFDAESGSNVGSTFWITRWSDAGVFLGTPIAIARATGVVTFESQVLVNVGSGSAGSYKPGMAISGDDDTGVQQVGGANTLSVVTAGNERLRVTDSRVFINGNGEQYGLGVRYVSTGGAVHFGATSNSASPDAAISNAGGGTLMTFANDGKITASGVYNNTVGGTNRDVFVDSGGLIGYVSSIRESKTDIVTLDDVSWLSALSPVSYRYRKKNADGTYSDEADGVTDYGLIAEDVEAVKPELCFYDGVDGEPQLRGVTYRKLITPMLRYIQQLEARIAALEERING